MIDVPSASIGLVRAGLQIVVAQRSPSIEIYYEIRNIRRNIQSDDRKYSANIQEISAEFYAVNIGGVTALNLRFYLEGNFWRDRGPGVRLGEVVRRMPPGQVMHLFSLGMHDIFPSDRKNEPLVVRMEYDSDSIANKILRGYRRLFSGALYVRTYEISPNQLSGDLPPIQYK